MITSHLGGQAILSKVPLGGDKELADYPSRTLSVLLDHETWFNEPVSPLLNPTMDLVNLLHTLIGRNTILSRQSLVINYYKIKMYYCYTRERRNVCRRQNQH